MTSAFQTTSDPRRLSGELASLAQEIKSFRSGLDGRVADHDRRLDALDRAMLRRPALARASAEDAPHAKALARYVRTGDEQGLRALDLETKALATAAPGDGGYLVDPVTSESVAGILRGASSIRSLASVVSVEATAYDVLIDTTDFGAEWRTETSAAGETATPALERRSITLHELSAQPKASQRLLEDSAFDVAGWLSERIADRFARAENAAFLTGDGTDKPTGMLTYDTVANASWVWGKIGHVPSGAAGGLAASAPADAIIDLIYALGARYRRNAAFVMNSATAGTLRKLKDAEERYLWTEAVVEGQPPRLFGYPVVIAEEMPGVVANETPIAFGDFRAAYTIAERPDLRILRDPYSAKPHVLFYASKRVGGDVTDFAAVKLLKIATS